MNDPEILTTMINEAEIKAKKYKQKKISCMDLTHLKIHYA